MDFLEIRRKAKERAAAAGAPAVTAAEPAAGPAAGPSPSPVSREAPGPDAAPASAVAPRFDRAAGTARAHPPPPAEAPPPAAPASDARFTTWRPGSGAPPVVAPPPSPAPPASAFAVFTPGLGARPFAAAPPAESAAGEPPGPPRDPAAPIAAPAVLVGPAATGFRLAPRAASADPLDEFFYRPDEEAPEIGALGMAAAVEAPDRPALEEFLTFRLGEEEYGVRIEQVREVLRSPPITEVPRAPAHVVGVVTVRGDVVAVCDPRRRLGLPAGRLADGQGRIVIVDAGAGPCGLLVDAVASVVRLPRGTVEARPQGFGGASAECLAGIGREGDRLFTVLDLEHLVRRAPRPAATAEDGRSHAER